MGWSDARGTRHRRVPRAPSPTSRAVDAATEDLLRHHRRAAAGEHGGGDHFAKPGANDRVWNALEKLALRAPEVVRALLRQRGDRDGRRRPGSGTGYQVTSQINVVNPGGAAQSAHRDYHMGFQTAEEIAGFPVQAHQLSPFLTLQGAVAHCDMPLESGPTLYLPFSQTFTPGYFAWRKPEFAAYFDAHRVQLPLAKGDAAFFNPALFHAAGHNRTSDVQAHRQPAAGLLGLWPRDGIGRSRRDGQGALPCPARRLGHEPRARSRT